MRLLAQRFDEAQRRACRLALSLFETGEDPEAVERALHRWQLRDRLALTADAELELDTDGDSIRLTPVRRRGRRVLEADGLPVIEAAEGRPITDLDVARWRDADHGPVGLP